jgi:hypothetical protein
MPSPRTRKAYRRRPAPPLEYPFDSYAPSYFHSDGFFLMWAFSCVAVILYFSGLAGVARNDRLYTELLVAAWGFYFIHPPLLKLRVIGPLLVLAGRLLLLAAVIGFFAGVYWAILSSHG